MVDCLDLCSDVDGDDFGSDWSLHTLGAGSTTVQDCTTDGSTPCTFGDAACLGPDCNDGAPGCTIDCSTDADNDAIVDCLDRCLDVDGDSYGADNLLGTSGGACLGADCDDTDSRVNGAQTAWFDMPATSGGYDYNCNGTEEFLYPAVAAYGADCSLTYPGWLDAVPPCGMDGPYVQSRQLVDTGNGSQCLDNIVIQMQSCR